MGGQYEYDWYEGVPADIEIAILEEYEEWVNEEQ